jgi:hypothetical protein
MFRHLAQFTKRVGIPNAVSKNIQLTAFTGRGINHVKNMYDENMKAKVEELHNLPLIEQTTRIYKPTYTVEFDRAGECLVYSCDPFQHMTIYLKYPYVLYESFIPLTMWLWYVNPLELAWYYNHINLVLMNVLWIPRLWYFRSLQYRIHRMWLLRGGKAVKFETHTLAGDRNWAWVENYNFHPLTLDQKNFDDRDNADYMENEGQLKNDLACQLDDFTEFGVNQQDILIYFLKQGVVHHPELFEAITKGFNIDTSDFTINTGHNVRAREGSTNF